MGSFSVSHRSFSGDPPRSVPVPGLTRYVPPAVIRVRQVERVRSAPLGDAGDQGSSGVRAVRRSALYVPVLRIVFDAVRHCPARYPVKLVIYIAYLCIRASITALIELGFAS